MISIPEMLKKLNDMYDKEERIFESANNILYIQTDSIKLVDELEKLKLEYAQLQEDKEILQNMIMYQSNKSNRGVK
jgi:hypothetical protein